MRAHRRPPDTLHPTPYTVHRTPYTLRRHCRSMGEARIERAVGAARERMPRLTQGLTLTHGLCLGLALNKKVNTPPERLRRNHERPTNLHILLRRGLIWAPHGFSLEEMKQPHRQGEDLPPYERWVGSKQRRSNRPQTLNPKP